MIFEKVDSDLPEPMEHLHPDLHVGEIEAAPATPEERGTMSRH